MIEIPQWNASDIHKQDWDNYVDSECGGFDNKIEFERLLSWESRRILGWIYSDGKLIAS